MSAAALDFAGVARAALAQCPGILRQWFPAGVLRGQEFVVGNLHGDKGESLSINVRSGKWADFASGQKGGDLVSLYAAMHGIGQGDAFRELSKDLGTGHHAPPSAQVIPLHKPADAAPAWRPLMPVPETAPKPPALHTKHGAPEHVAEVRDADGALLHLICRYPATEDRRKQICPLTYGTKDGKTGWHWKAPDAPRPLYGLDRLARHPERPVLIVEGEVKRDAAERMLQDRAVVISWPNGADGIGKADWRPLAGRDVAVWPDADTPGRNAAASVVNVLRGIAASVYAVTPPEEVEAGWDLADAEREGWTGDRVWARVAAGKPAARPAPPPSFDDGPAYGDEPPPHEPEADPDTSPFIALGHNRGRYFFYTRRGRQVLELSPRDLRSDACLLQLAPLRWWEGAFPGKETFNAKAAADALMDACFTRGIYDPDTMRGRGAWLDDGRAVLHLGNHLSVDGETVALDRFRSQHVYEQARRLHLDAAAEPLSTKEAARLLDLCRMPAWEDQEAHGRLLAGWLVAASVCGAMPWRPHLWITSEAGGGKSWVLDNLVRPILGGLALRVQSKTSEAGIRAELGVDARPVVFDEAETQNQRDRERMQQILDLARQASSEDGGVIIKGTADGGTRRYRIRSCFVFASVNLGLSQAADESRTVVLTLAPPTDPVERADRFDRMREAHAEILTPEFPARLLARTLSLLPTIRANAEVFAAAIARSGASRRTGDTLGVLLAGAWSLRSGRAATAAEAEAFIAGQAWVQDSARQASADPEWKRALQHLMQAEARFTNGNGRTEMTTLGVLIAAAAGMTDDTHPPRDADRFLRERGLRVKDGHLFVFGRSTEVARVFADSPWATGWLETLARTPGAKRNAPHRFTPTLQGKALKIPMEAVTGESEP